MDGGPERRRSGRRFAPLAVLALGLALALALDLHQWLDIDHLADSHARLIDWSRRLGVWAPLAYVGGYALAVAVSIPGATILTLAGGLMFGGWAGSLYAILGATVGACLVFQAARTALGDTLKGRAGSRLERLRAGFERDAFNYMLFLRLVPVFPFWLVNVAPSVLGVRFRTYALATVIGITPGGAVYAFLGAGLGDTISAGRDVGAMALISGELLVPLAALGALSLAPVGWRWWRERLAGGGGDGSGSPGGDVS